MIIAISFVAALTLSPFLILSSLNSAYGQVNSSVSFSSRASDAAAAAAAAVNSTGARSEIASSAAGAAAAAAANGESLSNIAAETASSVISHGGNAATAAAAAAAAAAAVAGAKPEAAAAAAAAAAAGKPFSDISVAAGGGAPGTAAAAAVQSVMAHGANSTAMSISQNLSKQQVPLQQIPSNLSNSESSSISALQPPSMPALPPSVPRPLNQTHPQTGPSNQATSLRQGEQPSPSASSAIPGIIIPQQPLQPPSQQPLQPPSQQPLQPPSVQTPAVSPISGLTADGTIDSIIFAPGTRWIATGNWSMVIRNGSVNSFNTNMTWYNNNGTGSHTHEILNFKLDTADKITVKPGDTNILLKGLMDVGTNHRITWTNVHGTIDIKGGKTISISLDDNETNRHFAGQTIYGIVKSFVRCSDEPGENMEVLEPCGTSSSPFP